MNSSVKYVSEKFSDQSDPIHDMGIGNLRKLVKYRIQKFTDLEDKQNNMIHYWYVIPQNPNNTAGLFCATFNEEVPDSKITRKGVKKYIDKLTKESELDEFFDSPATFNSGKQIYWVIKPKFTKYFETADVDSLDEAFTVDGDPVRDMGIGRPQWSDVKGGSVLRVKKFINGSHPKGSYVILSSVDRNSKGEITQLFYHNCYTKSQLWHKLDGGATFMPGTSWSVSPSFLKEYFEILPPWKLKRKKVNEAFSDESDPIQDLGIGVLSRLKPGNVLQCTLGIKPRVNTHGESGFVSKFWIMSGWYSVIKKIKIEKSSKKKTKIELELSTYDKFPKDMKMVDLKYSGGEYLTLFPEEFFEHFDILPTKINEKFTEDSDAIGDMNIGQNHFKEEIMNLIPIKYIHHDFDYIAYIRYVLFGDETSVEYSKDVLDNTVYTIICDEYSKDEFFHHLEFLLEKFGESLAKHHILVQNYNRLKRKGHKDKNKMTIRIEDAKKPAPTYESFKEDSDAIKDMGIGLEAAYEIWKKEIMSKRQVWAFSTPDECLEAIAYFGKTEFIDLVLEMGADIHADADQPLRSAAFRNHIDTGVKLIEKGANWIDAVKYCQTQHHGDTLAGLRAIKNLTNK